MEGKVEMILKKGHVILQPNDPLKKVLKYTKHEKHEQLIFDPIALFL
jgi:hypothetical protein